MGNCGSKDKKSRGIENEMQAENEMEESNVRLLLLGTGDSGKSTITKQIKIVHLNGYNKKERAEFCVPIINNIIFCALSLIKGCAMLEIETEATEATAAISKLPSPCALTHLPKDIADNVIEIWRDDGMQQAFARQSEFQLYDSAQYFFERCSDICAQGENYIPTNEDILRVRIKTSGIIDTEFTYASTKFKLIDVGGQRNERRKWLHCFDNITAALFVVAISEYDLKCFEDGKTNRMTESLNIFEEIANNQYFKDIPIILFLNKSDLFYQKIKTTPISVCFPEYVSPSESSEPQSSINYIKEQFLRRNKNSQKTIYTHLTCATNTEVVQTLFNSIQNVIINNEVRKTESV